MIKYFCDVCGEETKRNYVTERLKPEFCDDNCKVKCEVIVAVGGWNNGVICEECLRYALTQPEKKEESLSDKQGQVDTTKWRRSKIE
jgi:hypothetical protein